MCAVRRRNTIVDDIAEELRAMILSGQLKPGEFLEPQKTLADQFGVGLSTVRESIQVLAAVGLVESHPGKGTWVRQDALNTVFNSRVVKTRLGALNAQQVYEARLVIEVGLTRFAAERATEEEIATIWQAQRNMELTASLGDEEGFVKADLEFHFAVAKAGHNHLLEQFYHLVRDLLSEVITEMVALPNVKEESIVLQRAIAQAIEARDMQQAQDAAQKHMQYIETLLRIYS
jgi:GntR family transcriptional regulator, transcriptional repressor for pyruvate dehydrogenase complex